jgi:hypothetical protein
VLDAMLLAIVIAKLRRFKIAGMFRAWPMWPVFLCLVTNLVYQLLIFTGNYQLLKFATLNRTISMLSFIVPVIVYKRYRSAIVGAVSVFLGSAVNRLAMSANGGKMPVFATLSKITGYMSKDVLVNVSSYDSIHVLGSSQTKLKFLTDIFDTGFSVLSLGDILIKAYAIVITYSVIKYLNTTK